MGIHDEIFSGAKRSSEIKGIITSPHVGCLVTNRDAGTRIIGLSYGFDELNLDLLAGFFSAINVFSGNKIVGVTYKEGNAITFCRGEKLDVVLMSEECQNQEVNKEKMIDIVTQIEKNLLVMKTINNQKGDMRPYSEHVFEIVKRFPFYTIDGDYWGTYYPKVTSTIEEIAEKIPWCTGNTHELFEHVLPYLGGKRNILGLVTLAVTDKYTEADILGVLDVLFLYKFLEYIPIHSPENMFLNKVPQADCRKLERIYGDQFTVILELCDGSRNLIELTTDSKIPMESLTFVTKQMILDGIVKVETKRITQDYEEA